MTNTNYEGGQSDSDADAVNEGKILRFLIYFN